AGSSRHGAPPPLLHSDRHGLHLRHARRARGLERLTAIAASGRPPPSRAAPAPLADCYTVSSASRSGAASRQARSPKGGIRMRDDAIALAVVLMTYWSPGAAVAQVSSPNPPPAALATIQMSGRGFEEGLQDGDRFQLRLFIWSLEGTAQSLLGPAVSLFEPGCVAQFGR